MADDRADEGEAREVPPLADVVRDLWDLATAKQWEALRVEAIHMQAMHPASAYPPAFVAHALRQQGQLEEGYAWATRALDLEPDNLFARNRVSLLANLTARYEEAWACAAPVLAAWPRAADDVHNLAIVIVNAIHAADKLGRIPEAVAQLTPLIERLDHRELHFNSACMYALAGDERVWTYMAKALSTGKPKADFDDKDFDAVRGDPRFEALRARDWAAERGALERSRKRSRGELAPEDFVDPERLPHRSPLAPPAPAERHAELERAIDADVDDPAGYLVYGDWLQSRGDPRGLLASAGRRAEAARTEDERMLAYADWAALLHRHAPALLGPLAPHLARTTRATWQHGFIRELWFDVGWGSGGAGASARDAGALLAEVLALPVCRFLRALTVADLPADARLDYAPVVEVLLAEELPHLRTLAIGPDQYQLSWTSLHAAGLLARHPGLEALSLGAGEVETGALASAQLRRFQLRTSALTQANLEAICAARWPALEDLEVWFGSRDRGADAFTVRDLGPLLGARGLGRLRRLALRNSELTDEICAALAWAPIVPQLAEIDLSLGTMTDHGALILVECAPRLAHLARLCVEDNALSADAASQLQQALPCTVVGAQKRGRYVSVAE